MRDSTISYDLWASVWEVPEEYDLTGFMGYSLNPLGFYQDQIFFATSVGVPHSNITTFFRNKESIVLVSIKKEKDSAQQIVTVKAAGFVNGVNDNSILTSFW